MNNEFKRFRFEMIEGNYDEPTYRTCEVASHFPEDVTWVEVLLHFAHFLEGCGYVNVLLKMEKMLKDNPSYKAMQEDETFSYS
jgi:hypothetical protein